MCGITDKLLLYHELDRLSAEVDSVGQTFRYVYDSRNRLVFESDPQNVAGGALALSTLDTLGEYPELVSDVTLPAINDHGNTKTNAFDDANRVLEEAWYLRTDGQGGLSVDPAQAFDGRITTSQAYDKNGRLISRKDDGDANGIRNETRYLYDSLNPPDEDDLRGRDGGDRRTVRPRWAPAGRHRSERVHPSAALRRSTAAR